LKILLWKSTHDKRIPVEEDVYQGPATFSGYSTTSGGQEGTLGQKEQGFQRRAVLVY